MKTIPIHVAQADKPQNVRLEVTIPKMNVYNIDKVFHIIAAVLEPFECGKLCSRCDISREYESKIYDRHIYGCDGLFLRYRVLRDLCLRLKKLIDLGRFQVWDSDTRHALEFPYPEVTPGLGYFNFKNWARSGFIFPDDLSVFLAVEKIRASFVTYSLDPGGNIATEFSGETEEQCALASTTENALEDRSAELMSNRNQATLGRTMDDTLAKRRRHDNLAVEIEELLLSDPAMTPTKVWHALTAKIGSGNTCIVSATDVGLRWKRAAGGLDIASASNVADRVARWKKSRK